LDAIEEFHAETQRAAETQRREERAEEGGKTGEEY
jgi:hypothetical protein